MLSAQTHHRILNILFFIYVLMTLISRSGMQIFGGLIFITALLFIYRTSSWNSISEILKIYPWKLMVSFFGVIILGLIVNSAPSQAFSATLKFQAYILVCLTCVFILSNLNIPKRAVQGYLLVLIIVSSYAIFQSFTGIDILRPGSNSAVHAINLTERITVWRSAGLFNNPLHYADVFGAHSCILLAYFLLRKNLSFRGLNSLFAITYIVVTVSVLTTYSRGAWIASVTAAVVMAFLVRPRKGAQITAILICAIALALGISPGIRERLFSVFDPNFSSNSERIFLWRINFEIFKDHPFFGIGFTQNHFHAAEYAAKLGHPTAFVGHAHNTFLEILSSTGVVGLALYLTIIIYTMTLSIRFLKISEGKPFQWIALGCVGAQVFLHLGGLTETNFPNIIPNNTFLLLWAIVISGIHLATHETIRTT